MRAVAFVRHRPLALAVFALATLLGCSGPAPGPTITVQGRVEAPVIAPRGATSGAFYTLFGGDVMGGAPLPADEMVLVCVEGVEVPVVGCGRAYGDATAYAAFVTWTGATAVSVRGTPCACG